ncbi:MAG TPA: hypothetical protein ENN88_04410 [Candidatus Coatesbacteria bacterium]|nr:hypothetical protein [Candidatus Coatesbacteria bacterium]
MKKLLPLLLILALVMPATAINKDGLLSIGGRVFYWLPMDDFANAYTSSVGFGAKVGYGVAENFEILGEAWYGLAGFNEDYWGDTFEGTERDYYLVTFQLGGRLNLSPYSPFDPYVQVGAGYYSWAYTEVTENDQGEKQYTYGSAVSDDKFGINLRAGGEFFTSNNMSVDVGLEWNSIFGVNVPVRERVPIEDGFYYRYDTEEQTVNILTFGIGLNLYF